jgi:hypothetical protein
MGHVVASFQRTMKAAGDVARARGQEAVRTLRAAHVRSYVTRELSQYATTNDAELSAESVSEVVMRGSKARPLARAVVKVIDEHHQEFAKDM